MMTLKKIVIIFILATMMLVSCNSPEIANSNGKILNNQYSSGFQISEIEEGYILKVNNRFSDEENSTYDYLLSSSSESESSNNVIIHIPVSKVVCLSTTHCAFISVLGRNTSIKGLSTPEYVYNDEIQKMYQNGEIHNIGYDNQLNYEKIISINPDVVFAYGIDNAGMAGFEKLTDAGIPVVFVNDFIESTPLGRTEWIKFFACFYDQLDYANEYFDSVENRYLQLKGSVNSTDLSPEVLVGLPWKGTWWVPGGNSYFANFIADAGAKYVFADNKSEESVPLSIEEVFSSASNANFWINPNDASSVKDIPSVDSRIADFSPYRKAEIYNNNNRKSRSGGNDFWESGIIHPDIILNDLIQIFNTDTSSNTTLFYYKRLN